MEYATADVLTESHINAEHAASEHFPAATSRDGRYSWHSVAPGYVREVATGTTVYLQYGAQETDPETLAAMRSFRQAVDQLQEERRRARQDRDAQVAMAEHERIAGADRVWVVGADAGWMEWTRDLRPTGRRVLPPGPLTAYDPAFVAMIDDAIGVYSIRRP